MKRLILALYIGILLHTSCEKPTVVAPLPNDTMVLILRDLALMESVSTNLTPSAKDSIHTLYKDWILKTYEIDTITLSEMHLYLTQNPEESQELHKEAKEKLIQLQKLVNE